MLLTALVGEALTESALESVNGAVIGVMASMGNDLKNSSNEIPCRSLERPASANAFWSLSSQQTPSSMKSSVSKHALTWL